jgi:polysaccharide biosynthesis/export protein
MQRVFPTSNPKLSQLWTRRTAASGLLVLHTTASLLTTAVVFQWAGRSAQAQTPMPPTLPTLEPALPVAQQTPPQRVTAKEMIEAARKRLQAQGKLPPDAPATVSTAPTPLPPASPTPPSAIIPASPMPPGAPQAVTVPGLTQPVQQPFGTYRLGPGDGVSVFVQRFADFNFQAVVDPEGKITHPLLGKIAVQGLSVEQAQARVKQEVDRFIINPIVLLALTTQRPVQVTVAGEVTRPGLYPLSTQNSKVSAVLLAAGGSRENADLRSVKLRRPMPDGTIVEETLDFFAPLKEGRGLPDPRLQDGDTIVIPKLADGDLSYDRKVVARSTLVKPKITVRVLSYARGGLNQVTLDNGSNFLDALAVANINPDGIDLRKIALVRFDEQQKKAVSVQVDGKRALMGDMSQNVALQDNDVIVIGRNLVGKITYALNVFTQPFRDVLGFLLFFRQLSDSATDLFGPTRR